MTTQLVRLWTIAAEQRVQEEADSEMRWRETSQSFINYLIFNTQTRTKRHFRIKLKDGGIMLLAPLIHATVYDASYYDVTEPEDKDYKVRVQFEPLIEIFKGDKEAALAQIKVALDTYFPLPADSPFEWDPVWKTVPFKPKKKSDKRTKRLTLLFKWKRKQKEVE